MTGERCMPELHWGDVTHREHMARYALAQALVDQLVVEREAIRDPLARVEIKALDIASGEGYGGAMLRHSGADVIGVDSSPEAIQHAMSKYGGRHQVGDIRHLPSDWSFRFDLVACFETIEHVYEIPEALDELRRVMKPHGILVISTPNAWVYPKGNPFHEREISTDEFLIMLASRWPSVQLFRQREMTASALLPDDGPIGAGRFNITQGRLVQLNPIRRGSEMYATCVCSDRPRYVAGAVAV